MTASWLVRPTRAPAQDRGVLFERQARVTWLEARMEVVAAGAEAARHLAAARDLAALADLGVKARTCGRLLRTRTGQASSRL